MKRVIKKLIFIYLLLVLVKSILSYLIPAPSAFGDEYFYAKLARSFFFNQEFSIHNIVWNHYHPLYSIVLSPAYLLQQMGFIYPTMKILNSIISSLVIFPAYLISREFLNSKKSLTITILISLLPSNFIFSSFILAENLFYPTFLFSIYFIYKTFTTDRTIFAILSGIFIAISFLSKVNAIVLFPVLGVLFLYKLIKKQDLQFSKFVLITVISLAIISPWLINNFLTQSNALGGYTSEALTILELDKVIIKFMSNYIIYSGLLIISTGILFPLLISKKLFKKQYLIFTLIAFSSIFFTLIIAANHNVQLAPDNTSIEIPGKQISWLAGRIIGRYIDAVLPLVIILGALCLKHKTTLKRTVIVSGILAFSSQAILSQLLPMNHVSTSYLGVFNLLLEQVISFPTNIFVVAIILALLPLMIYKLDPKNFLKLFFIFLILINILNFSLIFYNSNTFWDNGQQMQLSKEFDSKNFPTSTIMFDERDCTSRILKLNQTSICDPSKSATIMGFWLNHDILIEPPEKFHEADYIISRHKLDLPIVASSNDNLYIYGFKENKQ
jgi:hypothetical protein